MLVDGVDALGRTPEAFAPSERLGRRPPERPEPQPWTSSPDGIRSTLASCHSPDHPFLSARQTCRPGTTWSARSPESHCFFLIGHMVHSRQECEQMPPQSERSQPELRGLDDRLSGPSHSVRAPQRAKTRQGQHRFWPARSVPWVRSPPQQTGTATGTSQVAGREARREDLAWIIHALRSENT